MSTPDQAFVRSYAALTAASGVGAVYGLRRVTRPTQRVRRAPIGGTLSGALCLGLAGFWLFARWSDRREFWRTHYPIVKQAVDRVDPFRLLATGAPSDEYGPEIRSLVRSLRYSEELTTDNVMEAFTGFWPDTINPVDAEEIARAVNAACA